MTDQVCGPSARNTKTPPGHEQDMSDNESIDADEDSEDGMNRGNRPRSRSDGSSSDDEESEDDATQADWSVAQARPQGRHRYRSLAAASRAPQERTRARSRHRGPFCSRSSSSRSASPRCVVLGSTAIPKASKCHTRGPFCAVEMSSEEEEDAPTHQDHGQVRGDAERVPIYPSGSQAPRADSSAVTTAATPVTTAVPATAAAPLAAAAAATVVAHDTKPRPVQLQRCPGIDPQTTEELRVAPQGGSPREYIVLLHKRSEEEGRAGVDEDLFMAVASELPSILRRPDPDPTCHASDYNWGERGFPGGEERFEAIAKATLASSAPLLLARQQTRREAHVLKARVGHISEVVASIHGHEEEPYNAVPTEAITRADAQYDESISQNALLSSRFRLLSHETTPIVKKLKPGQFCYIDHAHFPVRRLGMTSQASQMMQRMEDSLTPLLTAYITIGKPAQGCMVSEIEGALENLQENGWKLREAVHFMRQGDRNVWNLLSTAPTDPNSQSLIEEVWRNVTAAEKAGRHYPPQKRLEGHAKPLHVQLGLTRLKQLLLAGNDPRHSDAWSAMERGFLQKEVDAGYAIMDAVKKMRDGERRATHLLLDRDPRSDGIIDALLSEVTQEERDGADGGDTDAPIKYRSLSACPAGEASAVLDPKTYLADALCCPLTLESMMDPVIATDGCTYERRAIQAYFDRERAHGRIPRSPVSRQTITSEQLFPNRALKAVIEATAAGASVA